MCSDSYPIPILSLFFLYHPYIPYFLIQRIFHFLVSFLFLLHACMYSHQVYNSNGGLAPNIGITSSTCRHCTLSFLPLCAAHPYLVSFLFIPSLYSLLFNSKNFSFSSLLPFLLHACMYSHQVSNSNGGLASKIGLLLWQSWMVIHMNKHSPRISPL